VDSLEMFPDIFCTELHIYNMHWTRERRQISTVMMMMMKMVMFRCMR